jgi:hypothetical protein
MGCVKRKGSSRNKKACITNAGLRWIFSLLGLLLLAAGVLGMGRFPFLASYLAPDRAQDYGIIAFLAGIVLMVGCFVHFVYDTRASAAVGTSHRVNTDPRAQAALLELAKVATLSAHAVEALEFNSDREKIVFCSLTVGRILAEFEPVVDDYGARVKGWPAGGSCPLKKAGVEVGDRVFSLGEKTLWKNLLVEIMHNLNAITLITPLYMVRAIPEEELRALRAEKAAKKREGSAAGTGFGETRSMVASKDGKPVQVRAAANQLKVVNRIDVPGAEIHERQPHAKQAKEGEDPSAPAKNTVLFLPK